MGCTGCGNSGGLPKGCKNNGQCGTSGCGKLHVFDWLSGLEQPTEDLKFPYVEVRFKNERKEFFHNKNNIPLQIGDVVAVETNPGHDIGIVTLKGELARIQMRIKKINKPERLAQIYRVANQRDIDIWQENRQKESQMMLDARRIARETGLDMKISDVEYQGDGGKATFYYTSEDRVDFRQLIRDFASAFKCRIEMRQIGYRQEAAKLGGIGSCGRELCCSTWLTDFRSVSTNAARYQQLSINPQKIAGQCGKLKCCLNYELDSYLDALKDFPKSETLIESERGKASIVKIDVFKKEIWLSYIKSDNVTWYKFDCDEVNQFVSRNKKGEKIEPLEDLHKDKNAGETIFKDIIQENSLNRFETKKKKRNQKRKNKSFPKKGKQINSKKQKNED